MKTHGMSGTPTYKIWCGMKARARGQVYSEKARRNYAHVDMDPRWLDYVTFLADVGERPSDDMTLDRIDGSLGYWPGNVRWTDRLTQATNLRRTA